MGFNFVRNKKKKDLGDAGETNANITPLHGDHDNNHLLSTTKGVTEPPKHPSRRQKVLSKIMHKLHSKSKAHKATTPKEDAENRNTPSTIRMEEYHPWGTDGTVEVEMTVQDDPDEDPLSQSVLDEREFIRQQLFYEEQGVEVAAQFSPNANGTSSTTLYPASIQKPPRVPQSSTSSSSSKQEEKKEDVNTPSAFAWNQRKNAAVMVSPDYNHSNVKQQQQTPATGVSQSSYRTQETPLPPTPDLEPSEVDPLKHFPAVAAAVAKAEASRPRATAPPAALPVVRTVSEEQSYNTHSVSYSYASGTTVTTAMDRRPGGPAATSTTTSSSTPHYNPQTTEGGMVVTPPSPTSSPSPEKPFDEVDGPEDPTIAEMEQTEKQAKNNYSKARPLSKDPAAIEQEIDGMDDETANPKDEDDGQREDITRKLLEAFNCGSGTAATVAADDYMEVSSVAEKAVRSCRLVDAFYDNTCWTYREAADHKRPYYDERFAQRFLQDITEEGVNVLWHLPPSETSVAGDSNNWSGKSVVMQIKPGSCYSNLNDEVEPKLQWKSLSGGKRKKISARSIPLLDIQAIASFSDTILEEDEDDLFSNTCGGGGGMEDDLCLFAITTDEGDVHVFEATSTRERDLLVAGLKNVIARLSYHLIVGDAGASSELYCEDVKNPTNGQLPACTDATKNMNRIAHALLD